MPEARMKIGILMMVRRDGPESEMLESTDSDLSRASTCFGKLHSRGLLCFVVRETHLNLRSRLPRPY